LLLLLPLVALLIGCAGTVQAELTPEETKTARALIAQFRNRRFAVRQQAVDKLVAMGPDVLPMVRKTLAGTADGEVKMRCGMVIRRITRPQDDPGDAMPVDRAESAEALIERLAADDARERGTAAARLALMGPVVRPLVQRARDETEDPNVKTACDDVLKRLTLVPTPYGRPVRIPKVTDDRTRKTLVIGDFEDGTREGWSAMFGGRATTQQSAHAHGKRWLRVDAPKSTMWPGAILSRRPPVDWSGYRAVRFTAFNPYSEPFSTCVSVYDIRGTDYRDSFNRESCLRLKPGNNEIEVSIASMKTSLGGCRGIDVRKVRLFWFYLGKPEQPHTFYVDHVRLIAASADAPKRVLLTDFDGHGTARWRPFRMGGLAVAKRPDGTDGAGLKLTFPAGQGFPGVELHGFDDDWLSQDLLALDVLCPKDHLTAEHLSLRIAGTDGTQQYLCTRLGKGLHHLKVPLELGGMASLGRVGSLAVTVEHTPGNRVAWIDNVRLERVEGLTFGDPVHPPDAPGARLIIDMQKVEVPNFFSVAVVLWVPLKSGKIRVVHCTSPTRGGARYAVGPGTFRDIDEKTPIQLWAYIRAKGHWYWIRREVRLDGAAPVTLTLNDPGAFGHVNPAVLP